MKSILSACACFCFVSFCLYFQFNTCNIFSCLLFAILFSCVCFSAFSSNHYIFCFSNSYFFLLASFIFQKHCNFYKYMFSLFTSFSISQCKFVVKWKKNTKKINFEGCFDFKISLRKFVALQQSFIKIRESIPEFSAGKVSVFGDFLLGIFLHAD